MALPWIRLDTQFPSNPKILALVEAKKHRAAFAWVCALAYSGAHGTDGFLPASCLPFIHATKGDADDLARVGLLAVAPGGWDINGWSEFQQSSEESALRKKRAQSAALTRWHANGRGG